MRINKPLSREEMERGDLIPDGNYDFMVADAAETYSKAGSEMIKLTLKVWDKDGRERTIFDYLLDALPYKIAHFAEATGLFDKYQEGVLSADDCIGKSGECKIYIQKSKDPQYGDKNSVGDYLLPDDAQVAKQERKAAEAKGQPVDDLNDDLPF